MKYFIQNLFVFFAVTQLGLCQEIQININPSVMNGKLIIENQYFIEKDAFGITSIKLDSKPLNFNKYDSHLQIALTNDLQITKSSQLTITYADWADVSYTINQKEEAIMLLKGINFNKTLFIENAYNFDEDEYEISKITINNKPIQIETNNLQIALNLANYNIKLSDSIKIAIYHKNNLPIRVLNKQVLTTEKALELIISKVEFNTIEWTTKNQDITDGVFYIERYANQEWVIINELSNFINQTSDKKIIPIKHQNGQNIYRIRYKDLKNYHFYSEYFTYYHNGREVEFYDTDESKKVKLTSPAFFEIYNKSGDILLKGFGKNIDISKLKPDVYYIIFDNVSEKFFKY